MSLQSDLHAALTPLNEGRHKAALKAANSAMRTHRKEPAFPNIAGIALCGIGRQREAVGFFKKALSLDSGFHDAKKNLAQTLIVLNQPEVAERLLNRYVSDVAKDAAAWYLLAQARMALGHLSQAEAAVSTAIDLDPAPGRNYNLRALLRGKLGNTAEALDDFSVSLQRNPDDVETLVNISLPLARETRYDEAMAAINRAVALAPAHIGARLRLGGQLTETGDPKGAVAAFHTVLGLDPANAAALERLADLQTQEENKTLEPQIRSALKTAPRKSETRAALNFAMARIAGQRGDDDAATGWLRDANREMAAILPYNAAVESATTDAILDRFSAPSPVPDHSPSPPPRPVFVVGLPRSGTTLTEAVLGAHPDVRPSGERATAAILLSGLIETGEAFGPEQIAQFVRNDRRMLPEMPDGTAAYVDKMPENYRLIGFLKTAYPDCRIINLRRDPRDVALSMWRGHFSGTALSYTYDLGAMAHRFNLYARMMARWHEVFPGQILNLSYEALVQDVEQASKQLAEWCDLNWSPAMARPDLSSEQILTLSASQLRQPVHDRSVGKWRQHEPMLAPFVEGLDPTLWPEIT